MFVVCACMSCIFFILLFSLAVNKFLLLYVHPQLICQVLKYGNESQIDLIAAEVGGAVGAAPPGAQIELFNALVDGCTEAVELGNLDAKVNIMISSL